MRKINNLLLFFLLILIQRQSLIFAWQVNVAVELHDIDIKFDISIGLQANSCWMKKIYADQTIFNIGYNTTSGFYLHAFLDDSTRQPEVRAKSIRTFVPVMINRCSQLLKNNHIQFKKEHQKELNFSIRKIYNDNDIDIGMIELQVNNAIDAYKNNNAIHKNVVKMDAIVQSALDLLGCARDKKYLDLSNLSKYNSVNYGALKLHNAVLMMYEQKAAYEHKELISKMKKLKKLKDRLKQYC